ncbi:hypothetical protein N2152v2_000488 [Parachlorella kessleri]
MPSLEQQTLLPNPSQPEQDGQPHHQQQDQPQQLAGAAPAAAGADSLEHTPQQEVASGAGAVGPETAEGKAPTDAKSLGAAPKASAGNAATSKAGEQGAGKVAAKVDSSQQGPETTAATASGPVPQAALAASPATTQSQQQASMAAATSAGNQTQGQQTASTATTPAADQPQQQQAAQDASPAAIQQQPQATAAASPATTHLQESVSASPAAPQQQQQQAAAAIASPAKAETQPSPMPPAASSAQPLLSLSSHKCLEGKVEGRVCSLTDVWLLNATVYYVTNAPGVADLSSRDTWTSGAGSRGLVGSADIVPITPGDLRKLMEGAEPERIEEALAFTAGEDGVVTERDYFGSMLSMLPLLHSTLQLHQGKWGGAKLNSTAGEQVVPLLVQRGQQQQQQQDGGQTGEALKAPGWFKDALSCITPVAPQRLWERQQQRAVRLGTLIIGPEPPDCRNLQDCLGLGSPAGPQRLAAWRERLGECLGFDAQAPAPISPPSIAVLNRQYHQGAQVENGQELSVELQEVYGSHANVTYRSPAGLNLRQQAVLWSQASVAIHLHGDRALTNWLLLPRGAVVLHLVPRTRPYHERQLQLARLVEEALQLANNVTRLTLVNTDGMAAHLRVEEFADSPLWRGLTSDQKVAVYERGDCSVLPEEQREDPCIRRWLSAGVNLVVEPRVLHAAVGRALRVLHDKAALALPSGLGGAAGGSQGGQVDGLVLER